MLKLAKALLLQVCIDPTYKIALTLLFLCKLYQTLINFMKLYLVRPAKNNFLAKLAITLLFFWHDSPMPTRFVYVGLKSTQNSDVPSSSTLFLWYDSPMPTRNVYVGLNSTQNSEVPTSSVGCICWVEVKQSLSFEVELCTTTPILV